MFSVICVAEELGWCIGQTQWLILLDWVLIPALRVWKRSEKVFGGFGGCVVVHLQVHLSRYTFLTKMSGDVVDMTES